jgi:hypothetical protein
LADNSANLAAYPTIGPQPISSARPLPKFLKWGLDSTVRAVYSVPLENHGWAIVPVYLGDQGHRRPAPDLAAACGQEQEIRGEQCLNCRLDLAKDAIYAKPKLEAVGAGLLLFSDQL